MNRQDSAAIAALARIRTLRSRQRWWLQIPSIGDSKNTAYKKRKLAALEREDGAEEDEEGEIMTMRKRII
jgi:hypothetical protein